MITDQLMKLLVEERRDTTMVILEGQHILDRGHLDKQFVELITEIMSQAYIRGDNINKQIQLLEE